MDIFCTELVGPKLDQDNAYGAPPHKCIFVASITLTFRRLTSTIVDVPHR